MTVPGCVGAAQGPWECSGAAGLKEGSDLIAGPACQMLSVSKLLGLSELVSSLKIN